MEEEAPTSNEFHLFSSEAKKGYIGKPAEQFEVLSEQLELFEQSNVSKKLQAMHPFTCFGALIDKRTDEIVSVCCLIRPKQLIASCHKFAHSIPLDQTNFVENLRFVSFYDRERSSKVVKISFNRLFKDVETTQEYDMAIIEIEDALGDALGYLGLLANARSDDFDIQSAQKPIILLGLNTSKIIEYQTTLAMDVTYNYLTVFNIISSDNIAFVNDSDYGYCVIGVTSKSTLRQTIINSINHEKIEILYQSLTTNVAQTTPISKARKYLENKMKLQSKLIVGISEEECEKELAHPKGIKSIVRINNNCFASVCQSGSTIKIWNWKTGEQLSLLDSVFISGESISVPSDLQSSLKNNPQQTTTTTTSKPPQVISLHISGEFLLCLAANELFYFNWLTRTLERRIPAPPSITFTCMTCLPSDIDILIGCSNGQVLQYSFSQEKKHYVINSVYFDGSTLNSGPIKSILHLTSNYIILGFDQSLLALIKDSTLIDQYECCSTQSTPVDQLVFFEESSLIVAIHGSAFSILQITVLLQNKSRKRSIPNNDNNDNPEQEEVLLIPEIKLVNSMKVAGKINAVTALNDIELAIASNHALFVFNIHDTSNDSFTKHAHDISSIQMLNSEGFITGDVLGKIRAWIIGFHSPPSSASTSSVSSDAQGTTTTTTASSTAQSTAILETIDELTEISDKSVMLSQRSLINYHSIQQDDSSTQSAASLGVDLRRSASAEQALKLQHQTSENYKEEFKKNHKYFSLNESNKPTTAAAAATNEPATKSILIQEQSQDDDDEDPGTSIHSELPPASEIDEDVDFGTNQTNNNNNKVNNDDIINSTSSIPSTQLTNENSLIRQIKEPEISAAAFQRLIANGEKHLKQQQQSQQHRELEEFKSQRNSYPASTSSTSATNASEDQIDLLNIKLIELTQVSEKYKDQVEELVFEQNRLEQENNDLSHSNTQLAHQNKLLETKIAQLEQEKQMDAQRFNVLVNRIEEFKVFKDQIKASIAETQQDNIQLREKNEILSSKLESIAQKANEDSQTRESAFILELQKAKDEIEELIEKETQLVQDSKELESQIRQLESERKRDKEKYSSLSLQHETLKQTSIDQQSILSEFELSLKEAQLTISEGESRERALKVDIQKLQKKLTEQQQQLQQASNTANQKPAAQETIDELRRNLETVYKDLASNQAKLAASERLMERKQDDFKSRESLFAEQTNELQRQIDLLHTKLVEVQQEHTNNNNNDTSTSTARNNINDTSLSKEKQSEILLEKFLEVNSQNEQLKKRISALEKSNEKLVYNQSAVQQQVSELLLQPQSKNNHTNNSSIANLAENINSSRTPTKNHQQQQLQQQYQQPAAVTTASATIVSARSKDIPRKETATQKERVPLSQISQIPFTSSKSRTSSIEPEPNQPQHQQQQPSLHQPLQQLHQHILTQQQQQQQHKNQVPLTHQIIVRPSLQFDQKYASITSNAPSYFTHVIQPSSPQQQIMHQSRPSEQQHLEAPKQQLQLQQQPPHQQQQPPPAPQSINMTHKQNLQRIQQLKLGSIDFGVQYSTPNSMYAAEFLGPSSPQYADLTQLAIQANMQLQQQQNQQQFQQLPQQNNQAFQTPLRSPQARSMSTVGIPATSTTTTATTRTPTRQLEIITSPISTPSNQQQFQQKQSQQQQQQKIFLNTVKPAVQVHVPRSQQAQLNNPHQFSPLKHLGQDRFDSGHPNGANNTTTYYKTQEQQQQQQQQMQKNSDSLRLLQLSPSTQHIQVSPYSTKQAHHQTNQVMNRPQLATEQQFVFNSISPVASNPNMRTMPTPTHLTTPKRTSISTPFILNESSNQYSNRMQPQHPIQFTQKPKDISASHSHLLQQQQQQLQQQQQQQWNNRS